VQYAEDTYDKYIKPNLPSEYIIYVPTKISVICLNSKVIFDYTIRDPNAQAERKKMSSKLTYVRNFKT